MWVLGEVSGLWEGLKVVVRVICITRSLKNKGAKIGERGISLQLTSAYGGLEERKVFL